MTLFIDTSALYAVLDRDDANHASAAQRWHALLDGAARLLTSNYILVESSALVQHRLGLAALRVLFDVVVPVLDVHWISEDEHRAAMAALVVASRRKLSLVDCTSFEVMRRLGVHEAFAFDRHFAEQGFDLKH